MTSFIENYDYSHSIASFYYAILFMLWIIILLVLSLLSWLLISPLELEIDTRVPVVMIQWKSIGKAKLLYEDEQWWLKIRVLFFYKKWSLLQMIFADKEKRKKVRHTRRRKSSGQAKRLLKSFKMLKTFRVVQWEVAISSTDNTSNAYLYCLNFFPYTRQHVYVNFVDENYLVLRIRNKPWRIVYAFIR